MNRKILIGVSVGILALLLIAVYLYVTRDRAHDPETIADTECFIFQGDTPDAPCYSSSAPRHPVDSGTTIPQPPQSSGSDDVASSAVSIPANCSDARNLFERDGCIASYAITQKNVSLCGGVSQTLARIACEKNVSDTPIAIDAPRSSYETLLRSIPSAQKTPSLTLSTSTSPNFSLDSIKVENDPRLTRDAFDDRFKNNAPLALFGISAYQVRPGERITLSGTGFLNNNEVYFDGLVVPAASTNGFSLEVSVPGTVGTYEVWVTNSKGSSRASDRPMRITVTDTPAPLPVVTSISPILPSFSDTVTVSGSGFSVSNTVSTSLGPLLGVSSNGSSMQFRIADLPIAPLIKDVPQVKGTKIPVQMYVQSDGGITKDVFRFEVQF